MDFRKFFEAIKRGDINDVDQQVKSMGIDVKNLRNDKENFEQTPLFEACALKSPSVALQLVKYLLDCGVDAKQQDNLK